MTWGPRFTLGWGDYGKPDPADLQAKIKNATDGIDAGLMTRRTAVESIARDYDITDVDAYLDALEAESAERQADAMAMAHAAGVTDDDPTGEAGKPAAGGGARAGKDAPPAGGPRSGPVRGSPKPPARGGPGK